jgi:hypothetical protein
MSDTQESSTPKASPRKHTGACHCGAVRYEVVIDATAGSRCNCSVCTKTSVMGGAVKPDAFKLLSGEEDLSVYEWGAKISRRFFCKHCGVHCFGKGHLKEMGGDYVSVNFNTLDDYDPGETKVTYWDGRHDNWYAGTRSAPWPILARA